MRTDVVLRGMDFAQMRDCVTATRGPRTFWLPESPGDRHAPTLAAALLGLHPQVRVGTGVTPAPLRAPVDQVASYLTLSEAFPGRFELGVGSGNVTTLAKVGITPRPPLTEVGELVDVLTRARRGEPLDVPSDVPPTTPGCPILVAAHNKRMIDLACRVADGLILNVVPESDLKRTLEHVHRCAEKHGRRPRLGMFQTVALGGTEQERVATAAAVVGGFLRSPVVQSRLHAFESRYAGWTGALDAAAVRDFAALGEPELEERLDTLADSGFDFVGLSVFPAPMILRKAFPPVPVGHQSREVTLRLVTALDEAGR